MSGVIEDTHYFTRSEHECKCGLRVSIQRDLIFTSTYRCPSCGETNLVPSEKALEGRNPLP